VSQSPNLETLETNLRFCSTFNGCGVELPEAGRLDGKARPKVLLSDRHHACESIASFALEGLLGAILEGPATGCAGNVHFLAVPFVDRDGVGDGDQGKNRRRRDHNRDYDGVSVYPSVSAIRKLAESWRPGECRIALDLRCPALRGREHEEIHFVGGPMKEPWAHIERLSAILESP
jgi:hypothetical protein